MCKIDGRGGEGGWSKSRILGRTLSLNKVSICIRGWLCLLSCNLYHKIYTMLDQEPLMKHTFKY